MLASKVSPVPEGLSAPAPRVLVVDDEPLLRLMSADHLSDAGFDVLEASNAEEALRLLEEMDDISVVFTDVDMPGRLDGFELAERIEARWPRIGVLVTSGGRLPEEMRPAGGRRFVAKPYRPAEVVRLIDGFLSRRH